jgi:hypothetical protein
MCLCVLLHVTVWALGRQLHLGTNRISGSLPTAVTGLAGLRQVFGFKFRVLCGLSYWLMICLSQGVNY